MQRDLGRFVRALCLLGCRDVASSEAVGTPTRRRACELMLLAKETSPRLRLQALCSWTQAESALRVAPRNGGSPLKRAATAVGARECRAAPRA